MNKELKEILLDIFRREEKAAQVQESRGGYDIGRRSAVTAGKHFDPLSEYISKELQTYGVASESIFWNEKLNIPGWFRASKQWDMLAFHQEDMIAAIECLILIVAGFFATGCCRNVSTMLFGLCTWMLSTKM